MTKCLDTGFLCTVQIKNLEFKSQGETKKSFVMGRSVGWNGHTHREFECGSVGKMLELLENILMNLNAL